jgi:gamma-aminobutyric acid type B receptor
VLYIRFDELTLQVIEVIRHPRDKAESKYNPDAGVSKEDEERYQKLLNENEDLQRLITQVRCDQIG